MKGIGVRPRRHAMSDLPEIVHDLKYATIPHAWRKMPDFDKVLEDIGRLIAEAKQTGFDDGFAAARANPEYVSSGVYIEKPMDIINITLTE